MRSLLSRIFTREHAPVLVFAALVLLALVAVEWAVIFCLLPLNSPTEML